MSKQQEQFASMVGQLLTFVDTLPGYAVTLGDAYRSPEVTYGHPRSYHRKRLAIDLNLFIDGEWQKTTKAHEPLGLYWESIGGTWGGRFDDGNHYSLGESR